MIRLCKITEDNIWDVVKLSVNDNQKEFVATNTVSILEAFVTITSGSVAQPFAIYNDDTLIGFVMFSYGSDGYEEEPKIADGNYVLWRFMIDKNYQGQGLGKAALKASLDYIRTKPCGDAEYCWLSYEKENVVAKSLYASFGFIENGEMCGDEVVAVLKL